MNSVINVSVVVIGLNLGERLGLCLQSALAAAKENISCEIIYVDSGSTDGSVELASRFAGVRVLSLNDSRPSAAKARNVGWRAARGEYVQFLDGDMQLHAGWLSEAVSVLHNTSVGAVFGSLIEEHADSNPFSAAFGLDWNKPAGPVDLFGGAVMIPRGLLELCEGYNQTLRVGEDPDLALRIRRRGYKILSRRADMATHDLAITNFRQYWRRAASVGRSRALVFLSSGGTRLALRTLYPVLWCLGMLFLLLGAIFVPSLWPVPLALLAFRFVTHARRDRRRGFSILASYAHSLHLIFGKMPEAQGALIELVQKSRGGI